MLSPLAGLRINIPRSTDHRLGSMMKPSVSAQGNIGPIAGFLLPGYPAISRFRELHVTSRQSGHWNPSSWLAMLSSYSYSRGEDFFHFFPSLGCVFPTVHIRRSSGRLVYFVLKVVLKQSLHSFKRVVTLLAPSRKGTFPILTFASAGSIPFVSSCRGNSPYYTAGNVSLPSYVPAARSLHNVLNLETAR